MNSSYAAIEHVLLNLAANSKIKNTESLLHCGWSKGPMNNSLNLKKVALLLRCWILTILDFSNFIPLFGIKEKARHRSLEKETCCQLSSSQLLAFHFIERILMLMTVQLLRWWLTNQPQQAYTHNVMVCEFEETQHWQTAQQQVLPGGYPCKRKEKFIITPKWRKIYYHITWQQMIKFQERLISKDF